MLASLVKTIYLPEIAHFEDPTFTTVNLARWGFVETYVVIITASIPCLRSLIISSMRVMPSNKSSHAHTYELGSRYGRKSAPMNRRQSDSRLHGTLSRRNGQEGDSMDNILESDSVLYNITKQVDITMEIEDAPKS
jgi:hypothetical protein